MTADLVSLLGLGPRELVAFTGGGGKTTLLLGLGAQLAARGDRVLVTTTTRLGLDQTAGAAICWSPDPFDVEDALDRPGPVFVLSKGDEHKVGGYEPEIIDELFADSSARHVLVEADGSRGRPLKAPASHEPVVPAAATRVVVVMGMDAVGRTIFEAAHRPATACTLTGLAETDVITPQAAAAVLIHPDGGMKGIPDPARVVVALTKVDPGARAAALAVHDLVAAGPRVERVVMIPPMPGR